MRYTPPTGVSRRSGDEVRISRRPAVALKRNQQPRGRQPESGTMADGRFRISARPDAAAQQTDDEKFFAWLFQQGAQDRKRRNLARSLATDSRASQRRLSLENRGSRHWLEFSAEFRFGCVCGV
jgi:hypothetical protein